MTEKQRVVDARLHGGMFSRFTKVHPTSVGLVQYHAERTALGQKRSWRSRISLIRLHETRMLLKSSGSESQLDST
jgi:hypothetical protein